MGGDLWSFVMCEARGVWLIVGTAVVLVSVTGASMVEVTVVC